MKRLILLVAIATMGMVPSALAELCDNCQDAVVLAKGIHKCTTCEGVANRALKYCPKCAEKKGICEACGEGIKAVILAKYDKDGDGKLNEEERKAFDAVVAKRKADIDASSARHLTREEFLAKYDKDGDGKLNKEEQRKAIAGEHPAGRPAAGKMEEGVPSGK